MVSINEEPTVAEEASKVINRLWPTSALNPNEMEMIRKAKDIATRAMTTFPSERLLNEARHNVGIALGDLTYALTQEKIDKAKGAIEDWKNLLKAQGWAWGSEQFSRWFADAHDDPKPVLNDVDVRRASDAMLSSVLDSFLLPLNVTLFASTAVIGRGVWTPVLSAQNPDTDRLSKSTTTEKSAMLSFSGSPATPSLGTCVVVRVPEHPNVREAAWTGDAANANTIRIRSFQDRPHCY
jgi:hypothetical protein